MALPNWTDYETPCGAMPLSWLQMLASTIVGYQDLAGVTHNRINSLLVTDNCSSLEPLTTCANNHVEAERQLVENTFALDECGYLMLKIFNNQDNDWEDYGVCAEMPMSLLEMFAKAIVNYDDYYLINSVVNSGACTSVTALLDCNVNQIEAERLLVQNVFAVDDCGNTLIKLFSNSSAMTDYHTECVDMPETFYELLARCIVLYSGHYYLNVTVVPGYCDDIIDFWDCAINHIEPERALAENVFAEDSCGNLALKIFSNAGIKRGGGD